MKFEATFDNRKAMERQALALWQRRLCEEPMRVDVGTRRACEKTWAQVELKQSAVDQPLKIASEVRG